MSEQKERRRPLSTNEYEIEVIKRAFAGDESILKSVRSLFLGFPITKVEADVVRSVFNDKEVLQALRKKMYPRLSSEVPIGEESDFWFGTETEILDKSPESITQVVMSKQRTLDMLAQAFELLVNPDGAKIDLTFAPDLKSDPLQIELLTRNKYVKTVVTGLAIINVIAGQKNETVEQAKERLLKDSTK
jgi:hypothetical protein